MRICYRFPISLVGTISWEILVSFTWSGESGAERYIESAYHSLYRQLQSVSPLRSCFDMGWVYVNRHSIAHNFRRTLDVIDLVLLLPYAIGENPGD